MGEGFRVVETTARIYGCGWKLQLFGGRNTVGSSRKFLLGGNVDVSVFFV